MVPHILVINGGSSSIKFALYEGDARQWYGKLERIGLPNPLLNVTYTSTQKITQPLAANTQAEAIAALAGWLKANADVKGLDAVGHRLVHGGPNYRQPTRITPEMLAELHRIRGFAPEHLPVEIELIEAYIQQYPDLLHVACFDTAFHADLPRVAKLLPLPRRYDAMGIQRYGFHGLSYAYLMEELVRVAGRAAAQGRVVLAHLGNGASMAAVREGKSIDTTMSFTPTAGLVMSTRTGDLDPGLVAYLAHSEGMNADQFHAMVNQQSGLLGVSETSSDMRDLLSQQQSDVRAAEAVELFCYSAKRWIGGFTAVLGGLDTLVFSGGIGENAYEIRARICAGLQFLGVDIDLDRNAASQIKISSDQSRVAVLVIPTDEETMIARFTQRMFEARKYPTQKLVSD